MGDPSGEAEPRITDEAIERLRGRVGIPVKWGDRPREYVFLGRLDPSVRQRLRGRQPAVHGSRLRDGEPVGRPAGTPDVLHVYRRGREGAMDRRPGGCHVRRRSGPRDRPVPEARNAGPLFVL